MINMTLISFSRWYVYPSLVNGATWIPQHASVFFTVNGSQRGDVLRVAGDRAPWSARCAEFSVTVVAHLYYSYLKLYFGLINVERKVHRT